MEWEFALLDWMQTHLRSGFLDTVMPVITALANKGIFWIAVTLLMFVPRRTRKYAHVAAFALLLGLLCSNVILKPLIARIRPYDVQQVVLLIKAPTDFSFPSGHTQASFAVATSLCMWRRKIGIPALILASLIAFSRMYLYVHYPTDVLVGMLLGIGFAVLSLAIANRMFRKQPWDGCAGAEKRSEPLDTAE